jgi:hypothetical protein
MMLVLAVFSLSGRDHSLKEEIQHCGKILQDQVEKWPLRHYLGFSRKEQKS